MPIDAPLHTQDSAPEGSRELLRGIEDKYGFVPNILKQMAQSPTALDGTAHLMGLMDESSLTPAERWVVLLVVSTQAGEIGRAHV